jgi:predicted DNA-binding transcriptional regulator YafY
MTQAEAETLFLAGLPGPAAELGLAEQLSAARLKFLSALPATVQPNADRIASRFHLDPAGWFHERKPFPSLPAIAQAVWNERFLKLRYRRAGQSELAERKLGPLGLVLKGGTWYLVAQSGKSIRTYRAANIHDAEVLDEPFARPKGFDLAAHWATSSRDYEAGVYRERAEVRLSPQGYALLELLGPYVTEAAARTMQKPDAKGWIRCTLPIETTSFGVRELMRLGDDVDVLGPPALLAHWRERLAAMTARSAKARSPRR